MICEDPSQQPHLDELAARWQLSHTDESDFALAVRTELARMGCPTEVAEAVLGHSVKGIEGTYNLHRYEVECRDWLQRWSNELDSIANANSNIVQFPEVV